MGKAIFLLVAWRNLWRNRRRAILTMCAIAFGVFLIQIMMAVQSGSYDPMVKLGTRMGSGHLQILDSRHHKEPRIEYSVDQVTKRLNSLDSSENIQHATARAEGFVLISHDPSSAAALVMGVLPEREQLVSDLPSKVVEGEYLSSTSHAVIGAALSRNLGVGLGDELVLIGTNATGGLAAAVLDVGGIYEATSQLERTLVHMHLSTFQDVFEMPNQAHRFVAMVDDPQNLEPAYATLSSEVLEGELLLDWRELMPELIQGIQIDVISNGILQGVLALIIVLSIVNTFVMIMFERTREYGMLFAIGMQRTSVFRMALTEAVLMWMVGTFAGIVLTMVVVFPLMKTGIPIPVDQEMVQDQMSFMPDAIYPELSWWATGIAPVFIGIGTLIAVILTSIRLFRLKIVDSLRTE